MNEITVRWQEIREKCDDICRKCDRDPASVTIIAVSKTVPLDLMLQAYDIGIRDFGESRYQEAQPKIEAMPSDIRWHFIGKLQSNKARRIGESFDVIHTLEAQSQIRELEKCDKQIKALIEVNVTKEQQKAGIFPETLDETVDLLSCSQNVRFQGLMTIGPLVDDPEQNREVFRSLAQLGMRHRAEWLSMGMSADYDVAIQEGATHVRIGSALFGERK